MAEPAQVIEAKDFLRERLAVAASQILTDPDSEEGLTAMELLAKLASTVKAELDRSKFWLLMTCVAAATPTRDEFIRGFRALELSTPGLEHYEVLRACAGPASLGQSFARSIRLVTDAIVVDVDFCARHGHNTGVQRVVRETVSRWNASHEVTLTAWTEDGSLMRSLVADEEKRVLRWTSSMRPTTSAPDVDDLAQLILPWNCTIVLPEVAQHRVWERLSCLAEFSPNRVCLVGYDTIPVTTADYVVPSETDRFVRYLSVVKGADLVAGISQSSADEFAGFVATLRAQGLTGPKVVTVDLPVALAAQDAKAVAVERNSDIPMVLCVGTQEPRKNQLAVLAASEVLWQEGLDFELLFIGGAAMPLSIPFDAELWRLQRRGRPVSVKRNGTDAELEQAYRTARFSIFVSLHEGYGLPVGESLAVGTPVITTNYGSVAEIAAGGGCLPVDPRSDEEITAAMRRLLTDDEELARLQMQASTRVARTWDDYAGELWGAVVDGVDK